MSWELNEKNTRVNGFFIKFNGTRLSVCVEIVVKENGHLIQCSIVRHVHVHSLIQRMSRLTGCIILALVTAENNFTPKL